MTMTRAIETDRFKIKSPSGKTYTLIEKSDQIDATQLSDTAKRWETTQKSYLVLSGGMANQIDENTFFIVATDETATRI